MPQPEVQEGKMSFMDVWRSIAPMNDYAPDHHAWQAYREDIFVNDEEIRDKEGNTLLMFALWGGKQGVGQALFEMGCDPSAQNEKGFTVLQSLIRDVAPYKANRSPQYIAQILEQMPCTWHPIDTDGKCFDSHTIDHLKSWTRNFLLMDVNSSRSSISEIEKIVEFIATPLSYTHIRRLTDELRSDSTNHDGMVINHPSWQAQISKKAAEELMKVVPQRVRDELMEDRPRFQPRI